MEMNANTPSKATSVVPTSFGPVRSYSTSSRSSKKARNDLEVKKRLYDNDTFFQLSPGSWGKKLLTAQDMDNFICHEDFVKVLRLAFQVKVQAAKRRDIAIAIPVESFTEAQWNDLVQYIMQYSLSTRLGTHSSAVVSITRGQHPKTDYLIDKAMSSFTLQLDEVHNNIVGNDQECSVKNNSPLDLTGDSKSCGDGVALKYSKKQTDVLTQWMIDHRDHPFPNATEIMYLCTATNLSYSQVVNWTTNVRKRNLKATVEGGKKPHHFLDFVFLAHDRERRYTITGGSNSLDQTSRMRPRQLTLPPRPPSRQLGLGQERSCITTDLSKVKSEVHPSSLNIPHLGTYNAEISDFNPAVNSLEAFPETSMDLSMESIDLDLIEEGGAEGGLPNTSSSSPKEWIKESLSSAQYKGHRDFWEEIVESCLPGNILDIFDDGNMQHSMKFLEEVDSSMTEELLEQMNFDVPPTPAFDSPWKRGTSVLAESAERSVSPVLLFSTAESSVLSKTASSRTTSTNSCGKVNDERKNGLKGLDGNDSRHHCIPESDTSSDEDGINVLENELLFDKSFLMSSDISLFEPIPEEDLFEELMEPVDLLGN